MQINILIADDDASYRALLCDIVKKQGYHSYPAKDGKQALDIFFSDVGIDMCILDVMMPVYNGWEVLKEIREKSAVPVLMLTALGDEQYEIRGLKTGADDYIAKPFSFPVLTARIESLLRRIKQEQNSVRQYGNMAINKGTHRVSVLNREITLNNKEYQLLTLLTDNNGIVLSREKIFERIWGYDSESDIRTIDVHIKMLRDKLGICGSYIKTVRGNGYLFEVTDEKEHTY